MKRDGFWWERPHSLLLFFIFPLYLCFSYVLLDGPKEIGRVYFNLFYFFLGCYFLLSLGLASWWVSHGNRNSLPQRIDVRPLYLDVFFAFCLLGYLMMFLPFLTNPGLILGLLKGQVGIYDLKAAKGQIPGVSTLTQVGIAYVVMYGFIFRGKNPPAARYRLYLALLFVLTTLRAFLLAERVALIEVLIPYLLMRLSHTSIRNPLLRRFFTLGPFLGLVIFYIFFVAAEFNRSWILRYQHIYDSIYEFALERLSLYYTTALNNGAGLLETGNWGNLRGDYTFKWLYNFPILEKFLDPQGKSVEVFQSFISLHADPEYNSPSGIFVYFCDWGWAALLAPWILGALYGVTYAGWKKGQGLGYALYPIFMVSILEIFRYPYLFEGRAFVPVVMIVSVLWLSKLENYGRRLGR